MDPGAHPYFSKNWSEKRFNVGSFALPFKMKIVGLVLPPGVPVRTIVIYFLPSCSRNSCFDLCLALMIFIVCPSLMMHVSSKLVTKCSNTSPNVFPDLLHFPRLASRSSSNTVSTSVWKRPLCQHWYLFYRLLWLAVSRFFSEEFLLHDFPELCIMTVQL